MAFADAYTVKVHSTYDTVEMLNVFQVERVTSEIRAGDVREAFIDWIVPSWRSLIVDECVFTTLDVLSLNDPEDFELGFPVNIAGTVGGVVGTSLVAASIRFNRTRRDVRHGYVRLGGISEDSYTANSWIGSYVTQLEVMGARFLTTWEKVSPDLPACNLMVVKRVLVPAGDGHGEYYRLPETSGEYVAYRPTTAYISPRVTSQVSRKRGVSA